MAGGEPLLHPQIVDIVNGLVARKKYVYMCTNALELKKRLHEFTPSKYLTFSVHLDGQREHHDFSVCREGGYDIAMEGVHAAVLARWREVAAERIIADVEAASENANEWPLMSATVSMRLPAVWISPGLCTVSASSL